MAEHQEAVSIGELSRQLQKFEERLFGNGQPGILKEMDDRIDAGEGKFDWYAGFFAAFAVLLSAIEGWHILHK